jgi:hypothetical protein
MSPAANSDINVAILAADYAEVARLLAGNNADTSMDLMYTSRDDLPRIAILKRNAVALRLILDHFQAIGTRICQGDFDELLFRAMRKTPNDPRSPLLDVLLERIECLGPSYDFKIRQRGWSVLHDAASQGKEQVFRSLHSASQTEETLARLICQLKRKDEQDQTPLHIAASRGHRSTVEYLLTLDPQLAEIQDKSRDTAAHLAIRTSGTLQIAKCIVEKCPAILAVVDEKGNSPYRLAKLKGMEQDDEFYDDSESEPDRKVTFDADKKPYSYSDLENFLFESILRSELPMEALKIAFHGEGKTRWPH